LGGVKVGASAPVFRKEYLSAPRFWAKRVSTWSARIASRALGDMPVPEWIDYQRLPHAPIVWKSVESAGRLGLFSSSFPDTRAILLVRHPCGHLASNVRAVELRKAAPGSNSFEDEGLLDLLLRTEQARRYGLTLERLQAMTPAERLTWRWVVFNEKAIDDTAGLANCRVVRYEDVCADPFGVAKDLFRFAGLGWSKQTERFITASTSTHNHAYYSVSRIPCARPIAGARSCLQRPRTASSR
jgi:hypothetical protein